MSQVIAQDEKEKAWSSIIARLDLVIAAIGKSVWENNRLIICRWMSWACVQAIVNDRGEAVWIKGNYWGRLKKPIPSSCIFTFGTRSASEINTPPTLHWLPPFAALITGGCRGSASRRRHLLRALPRCLCGTRTASGSGLRSLAGLVSS